MASPAKRFEQAFPDQGQLYETLLDAQSDMGDGLLIIEEYRITYANAAAAEISGRSVEELLALPSVFDLIPMDERRRLAQRFDRAASLDRIRNHCESTILRRDGQRVELELSVQNVPTTFGRRVVVVARDVSERKQMERTLRSSEARYRLLFDSTVAGLCVSTIEGYLIQCNTAFARMLGFATAEEALANPASDLDLASPDGGAILRDLRARGVVTDFEIPLRRRDGSTAWVVGNATLLDRFDDGPTLVETIFIDVTERRALQAQLYQSQKLEAIGRLAGGVAHDFNNLLTAIQGYSELTLSDLGTHPLREQIEEIRKAAQRAATLTRQLLTFSRRQVVAPRVLDLNAVVRSLQSMLRPLIGENVALTAALTEPLCEVRADQGQLEQVIVNLVVNARDAMPDGGTITIETARADVRAGEARRYSGANPGPHAVLRVRDTGVGMTADVQAHLFEPFFTTKPAGRGTGLGLPTVYGIVQQSGGHLRVESRPGAGSTFAIYLPVASREQPAAPASSPVVQAKPGTETVLVVEDEPEVRALARRVLERQGYQVVEASQADEALQLSDARPGAIHLLLSDVVLPHMSGCALAGRLRSRRPEMKVLFMSGYDEDDLAQHGFTPDAARLLVKPFLPEELARVVRDVLDA